MGCNTKSETCLHFGHIYIAQKIRYMQITDWSDLCWYRLLHCESYNRLCLLKHYCICPGTEIDHH